MPTFKPRHTDNSSSFNRCNALPLTIISPSHGLSIPVNKFNKVDLPLPDGPVITTNSPVLIVKEMSCKTGFFNGPSV